MAFKIIFFEYFQGDLDVHEYLKNSSFLCLKDILKWKYYYRIYCLFLINLVPGISHLAIVAPNKHNPCT